MLNDLVAWCLGSVAYLLFLMLGIAYCVLHWTRRPHACGWTAAALSAAVLALVARPWLTDWPYLLSERFPDDLVYHSFMSAMLEVTPLGLLLWALSPELRHGNSSAEVTASDDTSEHASSRPQSQLPRWAWLAIMGATFLFAAQLAFVVFLSGEVGTVVMALLGAAPALLFLMWARFQWLRCQPNSPTKTSTSRGLEAALLIWFALPVVFIASGSLDEDHPMSFFLTSLASAIPVGLLVWAALRLPITSAAAKPLHPDVRPLKSGERTAVEFLWLILWGVGIGLVSAVLFPLAILGYEAVVQPGWYDGSGAGRGGGPSTASSIAILGTPAAFLIGFLAGAVIAAYRARRK